MEIKHNFATNLIKLRKSRKLNQTELGEAIHYSSKAISKWENEETMPDVEVLFMIASYFDVTIDELISSKDVVKRSYKKRNHLFISLSSSLLPYFLALMAFSFLYIFSINYFYMPFIVGAMASAITLIVFSSLWYSKTEVYLSILYLIIGVSLLFLFLFNFQYWWIVLIIALFMAVLFFVFFKISFTSHHKKEKKKE